MLALIIETSTTSAKAMLYDSQDRIIDMLIEPFPLTISNMSTQDAQEVYKFSMAVGRKIAQGKKVDIISISATWHSILLCDHNMTPITPTYLWSYTGAEQVVINIQKDKELTKELYARTGCIPHANYPLYKLMHLKELGYNTREAYILGQGSYTFYKMTGQRMVSRSMASGSGMLNIHTLDYDDTILNLIGIDRHQLGQLCNHTDIQALNSEAANLLGIKSGIPVIPTQPDGALNQVGAGALSNGVMTLSVGTSAALRVTSSSPVLNENANIWCYTTPISWLSGAATSGACNCVDWIKSEMFPPELTYKDIEEQMTLINKPPIFLPFLFGERSPGWKDDKKGGFFELSNHTTSEDMYLAVLEGVLFNILQCYKILVDHNGKPSKVILSGGILNSKFWTQMCSDILQVELECSDVDQTSMLGAAVLALEVSGEIKDIKDFKTEKGITIYPRKAYKEIYEKKYAEYEYWYNITS
ncbi:MAG: hypothetical protein K9L62_13830 [Vallitaleaceae bacterium]|nr:hypothetical protein [Vallitaleaceae bacterium]